ncbi:hypothetical protein L6R50_19500 [Myxococcota bacterium]|nr:hypothetical protein [Myxococcota bacterium]
MQFLANLRVRTAEAYGAAGQRPAGWLLSAHRIDARTRELALAERAAGIPLMADNGSKEHIDDVLRGYSERAAEIAREAAAARAPGEVRESGAPPSLRSAAAALAREVVEACEARVAGTDWSELLEAQISLRPTSLVAQEDFCVACLIGLDLERPLIGWSIRDVERRARRSLQLWERVAGDPRCRGVDVYAVLSGFDFNTARAAGRLAAARGVTHVAVGMAAINLDRETARTYRVGRRVLRLAASAPRRYVRLAQVASGIVAGYRDVGRSLQGFHALGLGAGAMFPVLAAAVGPDVALTCDSTSPLHDAVRDHVLYDRQNFGGRLPLPKVAQAVLSDGSWPCTCPFCSPYLAAHPPDLEQARSWWHGAGDPAIARSDLLPGRPLPAAVPLLTIAEGGAGQEALATRIASNHWALDQLGRDIPDGQMRVEWARSAFARMTRSPAATHRGIQAAAQVLWGADPPLGRPQGPG